jgi:hypothetical protein
MSQEHFAEEEQFVISQELLHMLGWLLKYEAAALSKIITQAYVKGCEEKLQTTDTIASFTQSDDTQNSVMHFLNYVEHELFTLTSREHSLKVIDPHVINALDHIDPKQFDFQTIQSTVLATAQKINHRQISDTKTLFLKELLKQWNPKQINNKKKILH